jgi:hypothetical protein
MIVWLTIMLCYGSTTQCHLWAPSNRPYMGLSACQIEGMESGAMYHAQHPNWTVKAIRCSPGNRPPLPEDQT